MAKRVRRKKVKLDTKGIRTFANTFGPQGQTFTVGLFKKKYASRGASLEFGDENQPARPWLSTVSLRGTTINKKILDELAEFAKATFKGEDRKQETAGNITELVKNYVIQQEFPSATTTPLHKNTIDKKIRLGRAYPTHVGIDTEEMVNSIKTTTSGGKAKKKIKE